MTEQRKEEEPSQPEQEMSRGMQTFILATIMIVIGGILIYQTMRVAPENDPYRECRLFFGHSKQCMGEVAVKRLLGE